MPLVIITTEEGQERFNEANVSMEPESQEIVIIDNECGVLQTFTYEETIDIKIDLVEP